MNAIYLLYGVVAVVGVVFVVVAGLVLPIWEILESRGSRPRPARKPPTPNGGADTPDNHSEAGRLAA